MVQRIITVTVNSRRFCRVLSLRRKDLKEKRKKQRRGDAESGSSGSTLFGNVYRELSGLCGKFAE